MAVSTIEERILGRLAKQTEPSNPLLSSALYQVLGLSILLSRKLFRARTVRRVDITRDTKSLQLYHQIIWLAREGLSITEVYILPYCQDGEQGPECRVMAAKLRASLYHIFCLFHNHPPISSISSRSPESNSSPRAPRTPKNDASYFRVSPGKSPKDAMESRKRPGKSHLRDPIPSMISDASYITNPYAGPAQTPPPQGPPPPLPPEAAHRRTPSHPPGLVPINIPSPRAAASFLLPPLNFVPMAREHFDTAQGLANSLLYPAHALRLVVSLEHAAFKRDCEKENDRAGRLALRAVKEVYGSNEGLDDDEFADASDLVQALLAIVKRGGASTKSSQPEFRPRTLREQASTSTGSPEQKIRSPQQQQPQQRPHIDRTIAISPPSTKTSRIPASPRQKTPLQRTPDRLSTVPEIDPSDPDPASTTATAVAETPIFPTSPPPKSPPEPIRPPVLSPPISRLSSQRSLQRPSRIPSLASSTAASEKDAKRRAVEAAEWEVYRRRASNASTTASVNPSLSASASGGLRAGIAGPASSSTSPGPLSLQPGVGEDPHSRQMTPENGYVRSLLPFEVPRESNGRAKTGAADVRRDERQEVRERRAREASR